MDRIKRLTPSLYIIKITSLLFVLFGAMLFSMSVGSADFGIKSLINILTGNEKNELLSRIVFDIRLPRILYALAIGGGLSISGAVFQSILMNPLAEPYILGISSGGTFGAVLSFTLGLTFAGTQVLSFSGALLVMIIVFILGKRYGEIEPNTLLLSGVMVGAFFSALILLMMSTLNDSLRTAVFWLIGNISMAPKEHVYPVLFASLLISIFLAGLSNKFNILSMGSYTAKQLGVNTELLKTIAYLLTSFLVGTLVSVSGIIGFVGLLIPHVCRLIFGNDNRIVFPASFIVGAVFLILCDTIARSVIAPAELPVGAITSLIGAPVFIYLLKRRRSSEVI